MSQPLTRAFVEDFYRARLTRDPDRIAPLLDEDVDWLIAGPIELLRFCGQRRGRAEVLHAIVDVMPTIMQVSKVELEAVLIDRNRVATFNRLTGVLRGSGRVISYQQAQFMQFRDGKLVHYRGIMDSFDAAEQMMGHPIDLPSQDAVLEIGDRIAV